VPPDFLNAVSLSSSAQVHHSSDHYNLSTALRQSWWQSATHFLELPLAFFFPMAIFVPCAAFNTLYQVRRIYGRHTAACLCSAVAKEDEGLVTLTVFIFFALCQFWIHTCVINRLGPLELIINTPSAHRMHHDRRWV
jgi:alkylglycerol monooxygenase